MQNLADMEESIKKDARDIGVALEKLIRKATRGSPIGDHLIFRFGMLIRHMTEAMPADMHRVKITQDWLDANDKSNLMTEAQRRPSPAEYAERYGDSRAAERLVKRGWRVQKPDAAATKSK